MSLGARFIAGLLGTGGSLRQFCCGRTGTLDFLITHYEWFEKHKEMIG